MLHKYIVMIRQDIKDVMSRRCGLDELNGFILLFGFIFIVLALFSHKWPFALFGAVLVILCCVRLFSKKLEQRRKENTVYMRYMGNVVRQSRYWKLCLKMFCKSMKDETYVYCVCRSCKQIIRVPKGKDKISIRCPKCGHTFIRKT